MIKVKPLIAATVMGAAMLAIQPASAQVAGATRTSVNTADIATGWSVKKKFLDKKVYNEDKKFVGKIEDIIIAPDGHASYLIIGAGGFVGVGRHNVAIESGELKEMDGKLVLP